MLVSIIIPAFRAQTMLRRAIESALGQTWRNLEVIVVSDDGVDYDHLLQAGGIADERLRFASTGMTASGCHNARNVGLAAARGDFVAALDADDVFLADRLRALLPLAQDHGAATDNPRVVAEEAGQVLYRPFNRQTRLDIPALLETSVPLFPMVAREYAEPRLAGIEFGEDFVANLRLIDKLGSLVAIEETLSEYRVAAGSLAHSDKSAEHFEQSYTALIERLEHGDKLGLSPNNAAFARDGLIAKREFNRAFARARAIEPQLNFQEFAARQLRASS